MRLKLIVFFSLLQMNVCRPPLFHSVPFQSSDDFFFEIFPSHSAAIIRTITKRILIIRIVGLAIRNDSNVS